jgi:hypothetical protein
MIMLCNGDIYKLIITYNRAVYVAIIRSRYTAVSTAVKYCGISAILFL